MSLCELLLPPLYVTHCNFLATSTRIFDYSWDSKPDGLPACRARIACPALPAEGNHPSQLSQPKRASSALSGEGDNPAEESQPCLANRRGQASRANIREPTLLCQPKDDMPRPACLVGQGRQTSPACLALSVCFATACRETRFTTTTRIAIWD